MLSASHFFEFWAIAFVTLCLALVLLAVFYRLIDSDLGLDSVRKEAVIAALASAVQAGGLWFSTSILPGRAPRLTVPVLVVAIIYKVGHLTDWSGYEIGGIILFQIVLWNTGLWLLAGQFKLALIVLGAFATGLALIGGMAKRV